MTVFQCPVCDLRFLLAPELEDHITRDHPNFRAEHQRVEDSMLASKKRRRRERDR